MKLADEIAQSLARVPELARRPVVLWGAGSLALQVLDMLGASAANVHAFVDGTEEHVGESLAGRPICAPDDLHRLRTPDTAVLVASSWWREIGVSLLNRGLAYGRDFFLVQRQKYAGAWNRDAKAPEPVFIGSKTYGHEYLLVHFPYVRPTCIGAFCSIASGARIAASHFRDAITTHPFTAHKIFGIISEDRFEKYAPYNPSPTIGNDVWIGANAQIMPGVNISNGAIIGANAVVTHDVPPYAVVGGCPARVIRHRFDERRIVLLQALQWWNWSDRKLRQHVEDFSHPPAFWRLAEQAVASLS